jgi:HPt (histidine-containing phosphotransfer) domain-containing protein
VARMFDESELLDRVDNDLEFLADTVEMLSTDGPAQIEKIRQAINANDADTVGREAHALKGMISNFCAPDTQHTALGLEQMGKAGDLASAPAAIEELEQQLRALVSELSSFVGGAR